MTMNRNFPFLIAAVLLSILLSLSCQVAQEESFGIYLADTGELVLSEQHIKAFHSDDNKLELNEKGIEKWNSYHVYKSKPNLGDCLFSRDFVIKIEGEELCRGKFWSMASSMSYDGVVILEALFKLDESHNRLIIGYGYPGPRMDSQYDAIHSELVRFFGKYNLLK